MKKILGIVASGLVAVAGVTYSPASQATTGYYFSTACIVPVMCGAPLPFWYGPYPDAASCSAAATAISQTISGRYPRATSNCALM